jgi:hypothetical protein
MEKRSSGVTGVAEFAEEKDALMVSEFVRPPFSKGNQAQLCANLQLLELL